MSEVTISETLTAEADVAVEVGSPAREWLETAVAVVFTAAAVLFASALAVVTYLS